MISFDKHAFERFRYWSHLKRRARHTTLDHALRAMFWLNRNAMYKRGYYADKVYAVKTDFIKHLYMMKRVDRVTKQRQVMICSFCHGDGDDPYDYDHDGSKTYYEPCRKCGGSGIYREHTLLKFRIGRYVWHQPASLVDYIISSDVEWDAEEKFEDRRMENSIVFSGDPLLEHWYALIVVYLKHVGVDVRKHQLVTLRKCIKVQNPFKRLVKDIQQRFKEYEVQKAIEDMSDFPF